MSSSGAGPDCCGGLGNVDFRQVRTGRRGWGSRETARGAGWVLRPAVGAAAAAANAQWAGPLLPGNGGGAWWGRGCAFEGVASACARVREGLCVSEKEFLSVCVYVCAPLGLCGQSCSESVCSV